MATCHERRGWHNLLPALSRMAWGFSKGLLAAVFFWPFVRDYVMTDAGVYYKHPEQIASTALLYFGVYIQILWLYLQFSGYCDISAGMARLLGYRQVENFNWPWLARSLREFWRRRHVTLNLILTFAICGLWHKLTLPMAIWGALMGAMLAINQAWSRWMARLDAAIEGGPGKAAKEKVSRCAGPIAARFEMTPMAQTADPGLRERGATSATGAAAEPVRGEEHRTPKWDRPAPLREMPAAAAARRPVSRLFVAMAKVRRAWLRAAPLPQILAWATTMHFFVHSLLIFFGGTGANRVLRELWRRVSGN
jgi:D-alanyl-lipoteichoic acid acyltransferase DltB (MBOAT superfamily)